MPLDAPPGTRCPNGTHRWKREEGGDGRCHDPKDIKAKEKPKTEPGTTTDTSGEPSTDTSTTEGEAPKEKGGVKDKLKGVGGKVKEGYGKVKESTAGRIISESGGRAVEFFNKEAKKRFKLGIPCPFAGTSVKGASSLCYFWGIPNKVFHTIFNSLGGMYQTTLDVLNDKRQKAGAEARLEGYDRATQAVNDLVEERAGTDGPVTMKDLEEIDNRLTDRMREINKEQGGTESQLADGLRNPRTREQWVARAEYEGLANIVNTARANTEKLKLEAYHGLTETQRAGMERQHKPQSDKKVVTPSGRTISIEDYLKPKR